MMPRAAQIELPLLNEALWAGGTLELLDADTRETCFNLKLPMYFDDLTTEDLSTEKPSGGSLWENRVHNARLRLVKKGQLEDLPSVGWANWQLTDLGVERLRQEHRAFPHEETGAGPQPLCAVCFSRQLTPAH